MIIVIKKEGKYPDDHADSVSIHTFDNLAKAENFIKKNNTGRQKYWVECEIVREEQKVCTYMED